MNRDVPYQKCFYLSSRSNLKNRVPDQGLSAMF